MLTANEILDIKRVNFKIRNRGLESKTGSLLIIHEYQCCVDIIQPYLTISFKIDCDYISIK